MPPRITQTPGPSPVTGILCGVGAFVSWGLFPLFWNLAREIPALEVLAHRAVWSLFFILIVILLRQRHSSLLTAFRDRRVIAVTFMSACLIACNWGIYIWAVTHGFVLQTSLGYFINPLLSILIGVFILGESLSANQKIAIGLAATGCLLMTVLVGEVPWISFLLAGSFAVYGYMRKMSPLTSLSGLALETALLFPVALGYLWYLHWQGMDSFGNDRTLDLVIMSTGIVTALPLLMFSEAARRIPLSMLGLLQYLAPSGQFLLAIFVYHENFSAGHLISFLFIWLALAVFSADLVRNSRRAN